MPIFKTIAAILLTALFAASPAFAADITVFAAASLSDVLKEIGKNYEAKTGQHVVFSFAASSALARQIEASGGADMFISADMDWMDELDGKNLIAKDTRKNLLGNTLVLISPVDLKVTLKIAPHFALAHDLGQSRLAIAEPGSVPAGKYAKEALTKLDVWNDVADRTAPAENVRAALAYVARGEAPFGIVYRTDAMAEPKVRIVDTFPESTHAPIVYPTALTKDAKPEARGFLDYIESAEARAVFEKDGFAVLN
ncbi:MAG TPA: molybdate ABC transporter substrate-binding protein [Rhizomicrobium sp.]|jgi:molybdate transport system substrate-binding protein|nr:molybdate ABC transporter substrate-binding protein [Rhizomicrobium sp.]